MKQRFIRLIKEHKVSHQFLRSSEIEMDITDEVRRQTGIDFRRIDPRTVIASEQIS